MVTKNVASDRENPRNGRRAGAEASSGAVHAKKRLLNQVLGERAIPAEAEEKATQTWRTSPIELVERSVITPGVAIHRFVERSVGRIR
jgi:hypothetical protein